MSTPTTPDTIDTYRDELYRNTSNTVERNGVRLTRYANPVFAWPPYVARITVDGVLYGGNHRNVEPAFREFAQLVEERSTPPEVTINTLLDLLSRAADRIEDEGRGDGFADEIRAAVRLYNAQNPLDDTD